MAKAWAKFPNQWVFDGKGLSNLAWRDHRTTALAAIMVMIALAVRLNLSHRTREQNRLVLDAPKLKVRATLDDLQDLTGFARATVVKALDLLKGFNAIRVSKEGRSNVYELVDIDKDGKYCQIPQEHLLNGSTRTLNRLAKMPRTRISLLAMKVYMVLLVRRNQRVNTTSISYSKLSGLAGVRREELFQALSHLTALDLIGLSDDVDARQDIDKSNRYKIVGLSHAA